MLTPSAGRARKGARRRGPAEAGARPMEGRASTTTAAMPRNNSVWPRCGGSVAFAVRIHFHGRRLGLYIPGHHAILAIASRRYTTNCYDTEVVDAELLGSYCEHTLQA